MLVQTFMTTLRQQKGGVGESIHHIFTHSLPELDQVYKSRTRSSFRNLYLVLTLFNRQRKTYLDLDTQPNKYIKKKSGFPSL